MNETKNPHYIRLIGGPRDGATIDVSDIPEDLSPGVMFEMVSPHDGSKHKYIISSEIKNGTAKAFFELPDVF